MLGGPAQNRTRFKIKSYEIVYDFGVHPPKSYTIWDQIVRNRIRFWGAPPKIVYDFVRKSYDFVYDFWQLPRSSTMKSYDFITISCCPDYDLATARPHHRGGGAHPYDLATATVPHHRGRGDTLQTSSSRCGGLAGLAWLAWLVWLAGLA